MSKYAVAVICALAFTAGGALALMFHHPAGGASAVQGVTNQGGEAGREGERASSVADVDSAKPAGEKTEAEEDATAEKDSEMRAASVKGRAKVDGRAAKRPRASRVYVRSYRGESSSGGPGVAGHAVRGVKKTGRAIGKTFGKIGGVFHD